MIISILLDHRKRLTPPNIEPHGDVTETWFRPVSAGFGGTLRSGTSPLAAERTARRCHRLEIHPAHVDTVICLQETVTGGRPRHAVSSRSIDDLAREAETANAR